MDEYLDCSSFKILGTIHEINKEGTLTNGPKDVKADNDAQEETICHEKKEEQDSPALKIAWMNQYEDAKAISKKSKNSFATVSKSSMASH